MNMTQRWQSIVEAAEKMGLDVTQPGVLAAVTERMGLNYNYARKLKSQVGSAASPEKQRFDQTIESYGVIDVEPPWRLSAEGSWAVFGDIQLPTTSSVWVDRLVETAVRRGVKRFIIAGDAFNGDFASQYVPVRTPPTWKQEKEAFIAFLDLMYTVFDEGWYIMGNHDRRMFKQTFGNLSAVDLRGMLVVDKPYMAKFQVSDWDHMYLTGSDSIPPWVVLHGRNYSTMPGRVNTDLCYNFLANILGHHQHHLAINWSKYGQFLAVDNGGLFRQEHMVYAAFDSSTSRKMQPGFTILEDGVPYVHGNYPWTNWKRQF